jgi:predicted PhzF superfamily epimerase YddE/YHI9
MPATTISEVAFEVRAIFNDAHGAIVEDPVTGSLRWARLFGSGRATGAYIAAQGTRLGRIGRIHISRDTDDK